MNIHTKIDQSCLERREIIILIPTFAVLIFGHMVRITEKASDRSPDGERRAAVHGGVGGSHHGQDGTDRGFPDIHTAEKRSIRTSAVQPRRIAVDEPVLDDYPRVTPQCLPISRHLVV
jgi:hypothetical protein